MTIHMNEKVLVLLLTYRPYTFCGHVRICFEDQCTLVALPRAIRQPLSANISSSVPHTHHITCQPVASKGSQEGQQGRVKGRSVRVGHRQVRRRFSFFTTEVNAMFQRNCRNLEIRARKTVLKHANLIGQHKTCTFSE